MQVAGTPLNFQFRDQGTMGIDKVGDRIVNIWYEDRYANVLNFAYGSPIPTYQGVFKFSNKQAAGGFGWEENSRIKSFGFYYFPRRLVLPS